MATIDQARSAKRRLREALAGNDGITGIGLAPVPEGAANSDAGQPAPSPGAESWCVRVDVASSDTAGDVPADVDGVPVQVCVTGRITAF